MKIINGKQIAQAIIEKLKLQPKPKKFFAAILVGDNQSSLSFLKQKEKTAKELGIDFRIYKFKDSSAEGLKNDELRSEINKIINQKPVGGAIIQLPLPENLNRNYILNAIPREKDVDVLSERALGAFYTGRNPILPPSVGVVEEIMRVMNTNLEIMKVVVIGPGFLIGQPIAVWLQNKVAELTILNKHTKDLETKLKNADIIISGVGKANLFSDDDVKKEALIIDFGVSVDDAGKIYGDFNASSINNSGFYTPTPGGTGPILVAKLFENFYKLCSG